MKESYIVRIKKNDTGEIRAVLWKFPWEEHSYFFWTDGNYGCDCNRELEFMRSHGESTKDIENNDTCSSGRYTVLDVTLADGTIIAIEK